VLCCGDNERLPDCLCLSLGSRSRNFHVISQRQLKGRGGIVRNRFLTALVIVSTLPAFAATQEQPSNVLHYRTRNSMMLVTVVIDGKDRTLVFDTGAEQTMINFPQVSRELKMLLWQRSYAYVKERSSLKLGSSSFLIYVLKADLTGNSLLKVADGVLGQDVLSNFSSIRINNRQRTIELFER